MPKSNYLEVVDDSDRECADGSGGCDSSWRCKVAGHGSDDRADD